MKTITYEQYRSTIDTIKTVWIASKLFSTKADRQSLLIINSKHTYATLINTRYNLVENQPMVTIETIFNKEFAQNVVSQAMQELLLGK